jgi:hypothetical protein
MTQVSEIIRQALRETNVVAITQDSSPSETAEGLARLQALVLSSLGNEVGYIMEDWNIKSASNITKPSGVPLTAAQATAFTVPPNARLVTALTAATAVLLDPQPQDGQRFSVVDAIKGLATYNLTVNPNGRKIEGNTTNKIMSTADAATQWLYRADAADWKVIDPLVTDAEFPFPPDFDDYFIIMLAMRLNPRYGRALSKESGARMEQQRAQFVKRYSQTRLRDGEMPERTGAAGG